MSSSALLSEETASVGHEMQRDSSLPEMTPTFHQLNDSLNSSDVLTQSQLSANEAGTPSSGADCTLKIPKDGNRNSAALKKKKKKRGI